ncbi:MAG: hypothetical protein ACON32_11295, partial [Pirellulaceae bacterium]
GWVPRNPAERSRILTTPVRENTLYSGVPDSFSMVHKHSINGIEVGKYSNLAGPVASPVPPSSQRTSVIPIDLGFSQRIVMPS